jgi:hypothetical protein
VIAVVRLIATILFAFAGLELYLAGSAMRDIQSIAGTSIDEAFYQKVGIAVQACSYVCAAVAVTTLGQYVNGVFADGTEPERR